jgi:tRNA A-37 threonylcarbamoyl transferase component Bud32
LAVSNQIEDDGLLPFVGTIDSDNSIAAWRRSSSSPLLPLIDACRNESLSTVAAWWCAIARALAKLHQHNVVHGRLASASIVVVDSNVLLGDWCHAPTDASKQSDYRAFAQLIVVTYPPSDEQRTALPSADDDDDAQLRALIFEIAERRYRLVERKL